MSSDVKRSTAKILHSFENEVEGKVCSKCKKWISLQNFWKDNKSWDGLFTICRFCKKKDTRHIQHKYIDEKEYKKCSKCEIWKIITEYSPMPNVWDKLSSHCKTCHNSVNKKYFGNNKKLLSDKAKNYRSNNKDEIYKKRCTGKAYVKMLINSMKSNDKKKQRKCQFTYEDWLYLKEKQNNKCIYTGLELVWKSKAGLCKGSIDRIDSSKDHTRDNCQLILYSINIMKSDMSVKKFDDLLNILQNNNIHDDEDYKNIDFINNKKLSLLVTSANCRNNTLGIKSKLKKSDIIKLIHENNNKCKISGVQLSWEKGNINQASIDQIIPGKGYYVDNIQLVVYSINRLKHINTTIETDFLLVNMLYFHTKNKINNSKPEM